LAKSLSKISIFLEYDIEKNDLIKIMILKIVKHYIWFQKRILNLIYFFRFSKFYF